MIIKLKLFNLIGGRGENRSLQKFLHSLGIQHRLSCPHTHQQNISLEHKHHHIVEIGLALLSHAQLP